MYTYYRIRFDGYFELLTKCCVNIIIHNTVNILLDQFELNLLNKIVIN